MCKVCTDCGILKPDEDYAKNGKDNGGLRNTCKLCDSYRVKLANSSPYRRAKNRFNTYCRDDKAKNYYFDLDDDYVTLMVEGCCYYCSDTDDLGYDRIDNNKGHTKDNVHLCCHSCNIARNTLYTPEEFKEIGLGIQRAKWSKYLNDMANMITRLNEITWYDVMNEHLELYYV